MDNSTAPAPLTANGTANKATLPQLLTVDVYNNGTISEANHVGTFALDLKGKWKVEGQYKDVLGVMAAFPNHTMNLADKEQNLLGAFTGKILPRPPGASINLTPNMTTGIGVESNPSWASSGGVSRPVGWLPPALGVLGAIHQYWIA